MAYNQTFTSLPNSGLLIITGEITPSTSYQTSDLIPIVSGAMYRMNNSGTTSKTIAVCYYDVDGNFIVGFDTPKYSNIDSTAPVNARSIRVCKRVGYDAKLTQLTKLDENPIPIEPEPEPEPTFDHVVTQADVDLFNAENVSLFVDGSLATVNDGFNIGDTIEFKPKDGYQIESISYRDGDGYQSSFTVADGGLSATDVYDGSDMDSYTFYVVVAADPEPVPDYVWLQSEIDTLENVVFTINGVLVVDGMGMFIGDTMTVTAVDGYEIVSAGYRDGDGFDIPFIVAGDYKSASLVFTDADDFNGFSVITQFIQPPDVKGYNDIYRVTDDQMREVATASFEFFNGQTTVDFGKYIIGAIDLPFEIRPDQITGFQNIGLGESITGINAELLTTDTIRVDMGSIFVPRVKNNLLDFANTVAVLHLPYAESVMIDIDYVIGETISIEYVVSLYDGLAIINVSSSKIDGIINTRNVDLNISIPFGNIDSNPSNNDPKNVELGGDNGIKTPHIEILRNDAVLENGFFTIPIIDESALINQIGFVKVDEIELLTSATMTERNKINSLLTSGVILK